MLVVLPICNDSQVLHESQKVCQNHKTMGFDFDSVGFLLLAGKVRRLEEREVVKEVLQQKLKRTVNDGNLFSLHQDTSLVTKPILEKVSSLRVSFLTTVVTIQGVISVMISTHH